MHKPGKLLWFIISLVFLIVPCVAMVRATQAFDALKASSAISHLSVNALAAITSEYLLVMLLGYLIAAVAAVSLLLCAASAVWGKSRS